MLEIEVQASNVLTLGEVYPDPVNEDAPRHLTLKFLRARRTTTVDHLPKPVKSTSVCLEMLSIRAFTRSVPRTLSRLSAPSARRPLSTIRQPSLLPPSWKLASKPRVAAFSTSRIAWEQEGEGVSITFRYTHAWLMQSVVDQELSAKLESELRMEKDMRDPEELPVTIKDYLENGPFEVGRRLKCSYRPLLTFL